MTAAGLHASARCEKLAGNGDRPAEPQIRPNKTTLLPELNGGASVTAFHIRFLFGAFPSYTIPVPVIAAMELL
jgi:hypothetical protein